MKICTRLVIATLLFQQFLGSFTFAAGPESRSSNPSTSPSTTPTTPPSTSPSTTPDAPPVASRFIQEEVTAYQVETAILDAYHILSTCMMGSQGLQILQQNRKQLDRDYELIATVDCTSELLQDFKTAEQFIQEGVNDYQDWNNSQKVQQGNELMLKARDLLYTAMALLRTLQPLIEKEVRQKKKPVIIPVPIPVPTPQPKPKKKEKTDDGGDPVPLPIPNQNDESDQDCPAPHFMATTSWTLDRTKRNFAPQTQNHRDIFFRQYPQLYPFANVIEVHHAIEQSVLNNYPGLFSDAEIVTDIRNLRGICGSGRALLHRSQVRLAWNAFYKTHPRNKTTRLDIMKECQRLDTQYAYFFYPYLNSALQPKLP